MPGGGAASRAHSPTHQRHRLAGQVSSSSKSSSTQTTNTAAGSTVQQAGGDTAIRGALAQGERVVPDIGGHLDIESLQDTSTYDSRQRNAGFSISVPIGPGVSFPYR
ncbi:hemagglutinin repeat-containing protein [Thauera sp.]|uniref:hemagglutinin repeat-containing protein n=1 Tax=Thauera sp. TaxID=1905334 RepID=UPI0039E3C2A1